MSKYKFCPKCGGDLSLKNRSGRKRLTCQKCKFVFYQNAVPTVGAIIVKDGKVLLGKRAIEPYKNMWDVIGGILEVDESPEVGLARELKEELGVGVVSIQLLGIKLGEYVYNPGYQKYALNLYYKVEIEGKLKAGDDIKEFRFFAPDEVPKKLAFNNNDEAIKEWFL
ncbi:MAG TPA: NUDIX hydrolase [Patescibacteria group bacterium]